MKEQYADVPQPFQQLEGESHRGKYHGKTFTPQKGGSRRARKKRRGRPRKKRKSECGDVGHLALRIRERRPLYVFILSLGMHKLAVAFQGETDTGVGSL